MVRKNAVILYKLQILAITLTKELNKENTSLIRIAQERYKLRSNLTCKPQSSMRLVNLIQMSSPKGLSQNIG